jgi:lipopolysaccharide biosynthesis regulator YciM
MNNLSGTEGLPLWDTFETILFFGTGVVIGIVFGFLFPSLWRAFRRRFRNSNRLDRLNLNPVDLENLPLAPSWLVEPATQDLDEVKTQAATDSGAIEQNFVSARALFQSGLPREAVQVYLSILKSPAASSQQSARVYLELAQVYGELGLVDRALATAKEYQSRRRSSHQALELTVTMAQKSASMVEIIAAVHRFRGNLQGAALAPLALTIAHTLCEYCEERLKQSSIGLGAPLQSADLKSLDESLNAAARVAPASLRLRHVRALRALHDALAAAKTSDEIWVSLFSEMSKRISLALAFSLPFAPAVAPLRIMLNQLAKMPQSESQAIETARAIAMREWLTAHNWTKARQAQVQLSYEVLLAADEGKRLGTRSTAPSLAEPLALVELAAFGPLSDFGLEPSGENSSAKLPMGDKISCIDALRIAITKHTCSNCGQAHLGFYWICMQCGARESLKPGFGQAAS